MTIDTSKIKQRFEALLQKTILDNYSHDCELHKASQYALEGQGKRIRPLLTYLSYIAAGGDSIELCDSSATAVEYIHTYSLMHDDLPCMDDDNERRGRPTTHVAFNEAMALLSGDSILTDSFRLILADSKLSFKQRTELALCLSESAGKDGMCLGQGLDLHWTGKDDFKMEALDQIHLNKTGKLISAACKMGAICANADTETVSKLGRFGLQLGLAFQVIDDVIDSYEDTGKSAGKDIEQGKLTYLRVMTAEEAKNKAKLITDEALLLIEEFGDKANMLRELGHWLLDRKK